MQEDSSSLQRVQTTRIRQAGEDDAFYVQITPAVQASGLGDGGSLCFDLDSVEKYGKILAIGDSDTINEDGHEFTYNIRRGMESGEFWIPIPTEALSALNIDLENGKLVDAAQLTVWAGPQMIFFKQKNTIQPIQFVRQLGEEWLSSWRSLAGGS